MGASKRLFTQIREEQEHLYGYYPSYRDENRQPQRKGFNTNKIKAKDNE